MQRVMLIGDSIRMGYEPFVRKELEGKMVVWAPIENCRHSSDVLDSLERWLSEAKPDVIHINAGLHDVLLDESDHNQIPIEDYRTNIAKAFATIEKSTEAVVVWASSTPVMDDRLLIARGRQIRRNSDVIKYNATALEIAQEYGPHIHDLYSYVEKAGVGGMLREDGIHFTEEASRTLGHEVANAVRIST